MSYTTNPLLLTGLGANGGDLLVTATSSGGAQTVHTASSDVTKQDYVSINVVNVGSSDVEVSLVWDGVVVSYGLIPFKKGCYKLCEPRPILNGAVVKVFASSSGVIYVQPGAGCARLTVS